MLINYDLPEDVVIEILSRLAVKSLLRFMCICKSWYALTKDLRFITNHLRQQEADNKKNGRLLVHNYIKDTDKFVFSLYLDETPTLPSFEYPDLVLSSEAFVLGPCNGIFFLFNNRDAVALWNPAMRQFRTLPSFPLPNPPLFEWPRPYDVFGFGFDSKTNDYKVIWIRQFSVLDDETGDSHVYYKQVGIYTLNNNSWREFNGNTLLPDIALISRCDKFYSYANGIYYWFANYCRMILSFDMVDEVFLTKSIPELLEPETGWWRRYAFYNDSLAWLLFYCDDEESYYSIWVLKEECWTKQVSIGPLLGVEAPLGFWKDGGFLLYRPTTYELMLAHSVTGEIRNLGSVPCNVFVYCESLVSIKEGGNEHNGQNGSSDQVIPDFFDVFYFNDSSSTSSS